MRGAPLLTRRQAGLATIAAGAFCLPAAAAASLTAADVVERLRQHRGETWREGGLDGFVAGDPQVIVKGIAVTAMPDVPTLRRAVAQGCNMIVSVESPFYARPYVVSGASAASGPNQTVERLQADPTYAGKLAFIAQNRLAIYRLSDNLGTPGTHPLIEGIAQAMRWGAYRSPAGTGRFDIPRGSLAALSRSLKRRLGINGGMRVIGQGDHSVSRVLVAPGRIDPVAIVKLLPEVDVLVAGDLREWELVEYFHDSWETNQPKALIAVGRIMSEQPGMLTAASWLRSIANLPVRPISVEDPYWRLPA